MPSGMTVRGALVYVTNHPEPPSDMLNMPAWEHIARGLIEVATSPNPKKPRSMTQASRAQKMLLDRMVGTRKPGSRPLSGDVKKLAFVDLTGGLLERGEEKPDEH